MSEDLVNVHIYPSSFKNESRIEKQAKSMDKLGFFSEILLVGMTGKGIDKYRKLNGRVSINLLGIENRNTYTLYKAMAFLLWYSSVIRFILPKRVKCINVHSLSSLPLGVFIKLIKRCKLVYDTHELETETNSLTGLRKKIAKIVERLFINNVDHIFVVTESIAKWYEENYNIIRPTVVLNVPTLSEKVKFNLFREKFLINSNQLIMIYQGDLSHGRGVDILLDAFLSRKNDDVVIVFMGDGQLKKNIVNASEKCKEIFYHEFVDTKDVIKYTSSADIGVSLIENTCLSYYYCLPNKLFEYAMAGLPMIVSNVYEMKKIVDEYEMGIVTTGIDVVSFNDAVTDMLQRNIAIYRENSRKVAEENSWEKQEIKLHCVYQELLFDEKA